MLLIYSEIRTKRINRPTTYDQNEEFMNVKAGGTYGYHTALKG
jgi:hypothetical protein